jgi:hypothetical protein
MNKKFYRNHDLPSHIGKSSYLWFGFRRNHSPPSYMEAIGYKSWRKIGENQKYNNDSIVRSMENTGERSIHTKIE